MSKFKDSFSKLKESMQNDTFKRRCSSIRSSKYFLDKEDLDKQFLTAVQRDDLHFVNYCIQIGIDVNCVNENHQTALHLIAEKGNKCIGTTLLKAPNINIDAKDSMGDTPLMYAVSNDQLKFVKLLLKSKANPNVQNHFEKTPLHIAVSRGDANLVTALLDYNADPNMQDAYGNTPLSLSTMEYPNENIAKILLMSGANPDLKTQKPQLLLTELCLNCTSKHELRFIKLLLKFGADVHTTNNISGQTPLHISSINGYLPLVELLVAKGANPHAEDNFGRTPVSMATDHGHTEVINWYKNWYKKKQETMRSSIRADKDLTPSLASLLRKKHSNKTVKFTDSSEDTIKGVSVESLI